MMTGRAAASSSRMTLDQVAEESGLSSECLQRACSREQVLGLAQYCDSVRVFGLALGLSEIEVNDVERDNERYEEKRVGLVLKWKQSLGFKATYSKFIEALLACGRAHAASEVCRQLAEIEAEANHSCASSSISLEQQSDQQLHDTVSVSKGEQGGGGRVLQVEALNEDQCLQDEAVSDHNSIRPPSGDRTFDIPTAELSDPASSDGLLSPADDHRTFLQIEIEALERQYQQIGKKLTTALETSNLTLNDLQKHVATLPMSVRRCYEELQKKNELPSQTKHATCMSDFVGVLYDYSNFLNPTLLLDIVSNFGNKETKLLTRTYQSELDEFQRTTTLEQFVNECMYEEDLPEGYVEIELVMNSNWQKKTLKDIKPPKRSWLLNKVYFGSLRVIFAVPDLSDLEEEDVQEFLLQHVSQVLVDKQCIYTFLGPEEDNVSVPENIETTEVMKPLHSNPYTNLNLQDNQALSINDSGTEAIDVIPEEYETVQHKGGYSLPDKIEFRFSPVTDKNVVLFPNRLTACRRDLHVYNPNGDIFLKMVEDLSQLHAENEEYRSESNAGIYIPTPLLGRFELEIEVFDSDRKIPDSLKIGIGRCPRGSPRNQDLPYRISYGSKDMCFWRGDSIYNKLSNHTVKTKYGSIDLHDLEEGDRVSMILSSSGDLSFGINGNYQGVAATNVYREDCDVYAVIDVSGSTTALRITRAAMSGSERPAPAVKQCHRSLEGVPTGADPIQFGFHSATGNNIMLLEDDLYARRSNPDDIYGNGVVYGAQPLKRRSIFEVAIDEHNENKWSGSLQVGVRRLLNNADLRRTFIPTNSEDGANHCMWVDDEVWNRMDLSLIRKEYGSAVLQDLRQGDTVGMRISSDGSLSFFVNGLAQGVATRGLFKRGHNIYPVVDIRSCCYAVRITRAETHSEVLDLQELCMEKIASSLDWSSDVKSLPLPPRLKSQIEHFMDYLD